MRLLPIWPDHGCGGVDPQSRAAQRCPDRRGDDQSLPMRHLSAHPRGDPRGNWPSFWRPSRHGKRVMGIKRRAFLIGGAALAGGGIFALQYGDYAGRRDALASTRADKAGSFTGWLRIGEDDHVTLFTPHIDMGTGNATALAQMAADE